MRSHLLRRRWHYIQMLQRFRRPILPGGLPREMTHLYFRWQNTADRCRARLGGDAGCLWDILAELQAFLSSAAATTSYKISPQFLDIDYALKMLLAASFGCRFWGWHSASIYALNNALSIFCRITPPSVSYQVPPCSFWPQSHRHRRTPRPHTLSFQEAICHLGIEPTGHI